MIKRFFLFIFIAVVIACLSACGKAPSIATKSYAETVESTPASIKESSLEGSIEESMEASPQKTDGEWISCLKSGSYVKQEVAQTTNPSKQKIRGIDFNFTTMTFSKGPEEIFSSTPFVGGPIVIKDDYLYAVWPEGYKLFVFKIQDDHTLIFCADRSHEMLSGGKDTPDQTVFVWYSNEYWSQSN